MKARKKLPPHWYHATLYTCVLCGRSDTLRERRFLPKPKDAARRYEYVERACGGHFA